MTDDEDRATRLRRRRQQSAERSDPARSATAESADSAASDGSAESDEAGDADESADAPDDGSVKDEQVGTYMYLPKRQKREIERVYGLLSTAYAYEYGEEFEKNRHFYPLLVAYGLDELDGLDAEAVRERLSALRESTGE